MTVVERLLLSFFSGAVLTVIACIASDDWRNRARGNERITCKDEPDTKAYMARLPGEAHTVERCVKVMRFGNPNWVPEFGHPLKPLREK